MFKNPVLDKRKEYPDPVPVLNLVQNGQTLPFLTKKSYSLWQGKQKFKKTTALSIAVAAFIKKASCTDATRFECAEPGIALFFDCKQGESYAARTMKLILKLAGEDESPNLIYCDLRELAPKERLEAIKAGIEGTPNVKLVVCDGVMDLMDDFMDAKEGHTTVTDLLKLCSQYDIHIAGVLHQNKGNSKDARAHVGSISSQKCEREIMAEVDPNDRYQSIISCKESRGLPFDNFAIRWDKGSLPIIVQDYIPSSAASSGDNKSKKFDLPHQFPPSAHLEALRKVFTSGEKLSSGEVIAGLMAAWPAMGGVMKESRAKTFRSFYVQEGYTLELKNQKGNMTLNELNPKYIESDSESVR